MSAQSSSSSSSSINSMQRLTASRMKFGCLRGGDEALSFASVDLGSGRLGGAQGWEVGSHVGMGEGGQSARHCKADCRVRQVRHKKEGPRAPGAHLLPVLAHRDQELEGHLARALEEVVPRPADREHHGHHLVAISLFGLGGPETNNSMRALQPLQQKHPNDFKMIQRNPDDPDITSYESL